MPERDMGKTPEAMGDVLAAVAQQLKFDHVALLLRAATHGNTGMVDLLVGDPRYRQFNAVELMLSQAELEGSCEISW